MTKQGIIDIFIRKGILSGKSGLVRRPFCWQSRFDEEARHIFAEFCKGYRSDEEAWFCLCRNVEMPICPVCGKGKVKFTGITKNGGVGYNTTCEHCSANAVVGKRLKTKQFFKNLTTQRKSDMVAKRRATNEKRYGEPNHMCYGSHSFAGLMQERYGTEVFSDRAKARKTCLDRYGVPTNLMIEETKRKAKAGAWSIECRRKRIAHCLEKNGKRYVTQIPKVKEKMTRTKREHIKSLEMQHDCRLLADVTQQFGQGYKRLGLEYLRFGMYVFVQNKDMPAVIAYSKEGTHTNKYSSKPEKEVVRFVRSIYDGEVVENCTSVVPNGNHRFFEIDIFMPELKLGIDFNGIYWHSTKFKDEMYHQRKTWCCRKAGIRMIHIFEDAWKKDCRKCKDIIAKCIAGEYKNEIGRKGKVIIGDNAYPLPSGATILEVTKPEKHQIGRMSYYDSGKVLYKMEGEKK